MAMEKREEIFSRGIIIDYKQIAIEKKMVEEQKKQRIFLGL